MYLYFNLFLDNEISIVGMFSFINVLPLSNIINYDYYDMQHDIMCGNCLESLNDDEVIKIKKIIELVENIIKKNKKKLINNIYINFKQYYDFNIY
jgi:hypothetical protein